MARGRRPQVSAGLLGRLVVLLGRGILLRWDAAAGVCAGADAEGVGDWQTHGAATRAAGAAQLLLHCGCGVFQRVPDEFPVDVFFAPVVGLQRAGVLGAGDSSKEAAENGAIDGSGRFQQSHGSQRRRVYGEAAWVESSWSETGRALTVSQITCAERTAGWILRILGILRA